MRDVTKNNLNLLFLGLKNGDRKKIEELYNIFFGDCFAIVKKNNGTLEDAKEVFQETLFSLLIKLENPEFEIKNLSGYLNQSFFNIWVTKRRKNQRIIPFDKVEYSTKVDNTKSDLEAIQQKEERLIKMNETIKILSKECQKVLSLFFFKNKSDKETASVLNYSIKFVKNKRRRCIKKLQELMFK